MLRRSVVLRKRGIRKVITGGKIKETFEIGETRDGKKVVTARKVFDEDEGVKARGDYKGSTGARR